MCIFMYDVTINEENAMNLKEIWEDLEKEKREKCCNYKILIKVKLKEV